MSDAYTKFVESLELDFDSWHDGEGYDLDALANIETSERGDVVHLLANREATWREIEALEHVDIPPAVMAIKRALRDSDSVDTRIAAAEALDRLGKLDGSLDEIIAREIRGLDRDASCTRVLLAAEQRPSEPVKQALLAASLKKSESSIHCAALLCFLSGVAKEPFDWDLRPLFLRLGPDEPNDDRQAAFAELCALVKMKSEPAPA